MSDNIETKIVYKENCNYQNSELVTELPVVKQDVDIQITSINNLYLNDGNVRNDTEGNEENIYYNETLEITIQTKINNLPLKYGLIKLYFFDLETKEEKIICSELLDNNGEVKCLHIPHHSGYYYAKYINIENNFFNETISERKNIEIKEIPTKTKVVSEKKIIDLEESVNLKVSVTDIYNNAVQYGGVTLLSYKNDIAEEEGYGIPIANPIILDEQGEGSIEYSPIQYGKKTSFFTYDYQTTNFYYNYKNMSFIEYIDDEGENQGDIYINNLYSENVNIEYINNDIVITYDDDLLTQNQQTESIKASYNFAQKNYNDSAFKYYQNSNSWTTINISQEKNILVEIGTLEDEEFKQSIRRDSDGLYEIKNDETICVQCKITDNDKNVIKFYQNNLPSFSVWLIGTTYDGEDINEKLLGSFIYEGEETYFTNIDGRKTLSYYITYQAINSFDLKKGMYSIYCIFDGGEGLPIESNINDIGINKETNTPKFKIYKPIESINYGLMITNSTESLKIILTADSQKILLGESVTIYIQVVSELEKEYSQEFINEYLKDFKIKIKNITTQETEEILLNEDLKGEFVFTPNFVGNYVFNASSSSIVNNDIVIKKGKEKSPLLIEVRDNAIPLLTKNITQTYPGTLQYEVKLKDYYLNEIYDISINIESENGFNYKKYIQLQNNNVFTETINNLNTGEYDITVSLNNNKITQKFNINKAKIEIQKINPISNTILNQFYNFTYEITTNTLFLDDNDLIIYFENEEIPLNSCERKTNNTYMFTHFVKKYYKPTTENINFIITGSNNYTEGEYDEQITSISSPPCFDIIETDDINKTIKMKIHLPEEFGGYHTNEYIPGLAIVNIDKETEECLVLFDSNGECILNFNSFTSLTWNNIERNLSIQIFTNIDNIEFNNEDEILEFLINKTTNPSNLSYSENFNTYLSNLYYQYLLYNDIFCIGYDDSIIEKKYF